MQQLVNAVRSSGARNPLMLGGIGLCGDESKWAQYEPRTRHQLVVSFHTYNFTGCNNAACWNQAIAPIAATTPVVTGEFGETDLRRQLLARLHELGDATASLPRLTWSDRPAAELQRRSCLIVNYAASDATHQAAEPLAALAAGRPPRAMRDHERAPTS